MTITIDFLDQALGIVEQAIEGSPTDGPSLAHANDLIDTLFATNFADASLTDTSIANRKLDGIKSRLKNIIQKAHRVIPASVSIASVTERGVVVGNIDTPLASTEVIPNHGGVPLL